MHAKQLIRERFKDLLTDATNIPVEANRAHTLSAFPLFNIRSGRDEGVIEDYTNTSKPRRYDLMIEMHVASNNHDNDLDDMQKIVEDVLEANPTSPDWSACFFESADEPEDVAGKTVYSKCTVHTIFMFEV